MKTIFKQVLEGLGVIYVVADDENEERKMIIGSYGNDNDSTTITFKDHEITETYDKACNILIDARYRKIEEERARNESLYELKKKLIELGFE